MCPRKEGSDMERVLFIVVTLLLRPSPGQEGKPPTKETAKAPQAAEEVLTVAWKEGVAIRVRIPVAGPDRKCMTTIAFPEDKIETAVSGWGEELTAVDNGGRLFLRLSKKSEGELGVIGTSGTHYLLYLVGVEEPKPSAYDRYVRVTKADDRPSNALPKRAQRRPTGAIALLQAMRLGLRPEGGRILRAAGEPAFQSETIETSLAYVYQTPDFTGYIYDLENRTEVGQAVDASRIKAKQGTLVLSSLRENVVPARGKTRLYAVFWRE